MPRRDEMELDKGKGKTMRLLVRLTPEELDRLHNWKDSKAWSLQKLAKTVLMDECGKAGF